MSEMKELVEVIAKSLVDLPDKVVVTERETEKGLVLELKVDPTDMGKVIGHVTTGYNSISTGKSVAMALIETSSAKIGTRLDVRIHRKLHKATVVKKKFYDKKYKK